MPDGLSKIADLARQGCAIHTHDGFVLKLAALLVLTSRLFRDTANLPHTKAKLEKYQPDLMKVRM